MRCECVSPQQAFGNRKLSYQIRKENQAIKRNYNLMKVKTSSKLSIFSLFILALACTMLLSIGVSADTYKESDYSRVYDYEYYVKNNKDLSSSIRSSRTKALTHFVEHGMAQQRQAISYFNVKLYKSNYPDLAKLYGTNYKKYYEHFQKVGYRLRFAKHPLSYYSFELTVDPNGGKYKNSTKDTILKHHYGRKITLSEPVRDDYEFVGWKLVKGRGTLSGKTFVYTMDRKGVNTIRAQWAKEAEASYSGASKIADVALTQLGNGGETYWNYFSDIFSSPQEWCCMFVSYCAYKAGLISKTASYESFGNGHFPRTANQRELATQFAKRGQLRLRSTGYKPQKGDIIFFSYNSDKSNYQSYSHVGIVVGTSGDEVITVEGNTGTYNKYTSYVKKKTYALDNSRIASYGIIK